ncbi:hypothetical protein MTR67_035707 [Solanum verrucosum]|uniref:Uncharacterized protein n=1 Tax=Solanum verrucosum TaxID=315347 RepID=A0AAF0UAD7_SOLVR|nr:hypothetical protein MTR67_035707 [Solanum verrucosum]
MHIDHVIPENLEEVNQLRLDGRWNVNLMNELFDKDICDHYQKQRLLELLVDATASNQDSNDSAECGGERRLSCPKFSF